MRHTIAFHNLRKSELATTILMYLVILYMLLLLYLTSNSVVTTFAGFDKSGLIFLCIVLLGWFFSFWISYIALIGIAEKIESNFPSIIFKSNNYKRLVKIFNTVHPKPMVIISISRKDVTTHNTSVTIYIANLSIDEIRGQSLWEIPVTSADMPIESFPNQRIPGFVYFDPRTNRPAILETELGLFWANSFI